MSSRVKKFLAYYKPYLGLLLLDLGCAVVVTVTTLLLPLCTSFITKNLLSEAISKALEPIYLVGAFMLVLVAVQTACNTFVDYMGHMMGTRMEGDMRRDLFEHYQKLSFSFYDDKQTGQLMSHITVDLVALTELCHHGPEDLAIAFLKLTGVLIILFTINVPLALLTFSFFPFMLVYAFYFNRKMNRALSESRARIGDINA